MPYLILFEHTNADRAVTCPLARAKSEIAARLAATRGARLVTFTYVGAVAESLVRPGDGFEGGLAVSGMFGHGGTS